MNDFVKYLLLEHQAYDILKLIVEMLNDNKHLSIKNLIENISSEHIFWRDKIVDIMKKYF